MKKTLLLAACLVLLRPAWGQATDPVAEATAIAAQRDAEERTKRLAADVQTILETQELLQRRQEELRQRLEKLTEDVRGLKEDQARNSGNYASKDELRDYVRKLKELDDKREADKKLILDNIKGLANVQVAPPPEPRATEPRPSPRRTEPTADQGREGNEYKVQRNDRLLDIIAAYNKHYKEQGLGQITLREVLQLNPNLKQNLLRTGQTILIPIPAKENK